MNYLTSYFVSEYCTSLLTAQCSAASRAGICLFGRSFLAVAKGTTENAGLENAGLSYRWMENARPVAMERRWYQYCKT